LVSYGHTITTKDTTSHRILIVELHSEHLELIKQFTCGEAEQDNFLKEEAWIGQKAGVNKTLLFLNKGRLWGYAAYAMSRLRTPDPDEYYKTLGLKNLGYGPPPVFLIAQFAISTELQGRGAGLELLEFVKDHLKHLAISIGGTGILLSVAMDKNGERRIRFYEKGGFETLSKKPEKGKIQMFFSLANFFEEVYS
jgi:GNAT superfamily N-acetyltransferase